MMQAGHVVTDDGVRLAWRVDGDPSCPPLLLANSLGTTLRMWDDQIPDWAQSHRVLRFDTCGHGDSAVRPSGFGIERLAKDALCVLDHLEVVAADFVGLSLGGMIGQWLAINAPHRLRRLVLANTSAYMPPRDAWDERRRLVTSLGMEAVADTVLQRWFAFEETRDSLRGKTLLRDLLACNPAGYAAACAAIRDMDFRPELQAIACETLIIAGSCDQATPPDHSHLLHRMITDSQIAWLEAGHISSIECPSEFGRIVSDFLAR